MSKSLRMLLLSMLVVAVAAMPAMAASYPTKFYWTGSAGDNYWGNYVNWSADIPYSSDLGIANNAYYPGRTSDDVKVVVSNDALIYLTTPDNSKTTGALSSKITFIEINDAKVSIDLGAYGYFNTMPSIDVVSGSLKLKGSVAREITSAPTWKANGALTLDLPVTLSSKLTISVDDAPLTINQSTLLRSTDIRVTGSKGSLVLNVSPETPAAKRRLTIMLLNGAVLNTSSADVTLYANYDVDPSKDISLISCDTFTKTGAKTLTLLRTNTTSYDLPIRSSVTKVNINGGSLVFGSRAIAASSIDIVVSTDAKLDINAARAIATGRLVQLTVNGEAEIASVGVGNAAGIYNSDAPNKLNLTPFNLSADVKSKGTLTFKGDQPVAHLKGAGTVVVSGDYALIVECNSKDINGFTGTLNATGVGLATSFDNMPFVNASADISTIYVYGGATLTLDAKKLADVEGMEATTIYLRSDHNAVTEAALTASTVGDLAVSGDVALGTLKVDGTKNGVAGVLLPSSKDVLTVDSLVLHANRKLDTASATTYAAVDAILISGDGKFVPKAIANDTGSTYGGLGSDKAITVQGATLKLDVDIPAYNSLLLNGGKLDAANGVSIPGDLAIQNTNDKSNYIKVAVTADNGSDLYSTGHSALNVGGNLTLNGHISIDMTLEDTGRFLGKRYKLVGPADSAAFSKVTSKDVSIDVVGTYNDVMHVSYDLRGVYGILEKLIQVPVLGGSDTKQWKVLGDPDTFGSGKSEFTAKLSYDLPADVTPEGLINLIVVSIDIEGEKFSNNGVTRKLVQANGKDVVYISSLEVNSKDKEIVLTGTSYVTNLDTQVALSWSKVSKDWVPYEKAGMYYGSRKIESQDFRALDYQDRSITNPVEEKPADPAISADVSADPTIVTVTPAEDSLEITAGYSGDVELTITGIRERVESNAALPVFVNGSYVWMNGYDTTKKYEIRYNNIWEPIDSIDIKIDGVSIPSSSFTIEGSNPITVKISADRFAPNPTVPVEQEVQLTAKFVNGGNTIATETATVRIVPDYETRPVDEGMGVRSYTTTTIPASKVTVVSQIPLEGTLSYDFSGTMPEAWIDADDLAAGVISYRIPAGTAAGTYDMSVITYTANGGYRYNFSVVITEAYAFSVSDPEELYDMYAGRNYEAHFTTNAPEGTPVYTLTTDVNWLKGVPSGDMFVVYGQLPAYDLNGDEEADEYTYVVTATLSGDTASKEVTITVDEDDTDPADIHNAAFSSTAIGTITYSGDKSINSADTNYNVTIAFTEDNYGEINFTSFPYWLVATPVVNADDETTGYTITYKTGTAVAAGESGLVRFDDPEEGVVQWAVTFVETTVPDVPGPTSPDQPSGPTSPDQPAPTSPDQPSGPTALTVTASQTALTLTAGTTATVTMTSSVSGVTYTSDKTWAVVEGSTVTITAPSATDTVTITGTAPDGRTASVTITVTVSGSSVVTSFSVTASPSIVRVSEDETATVTLTPSNATGTVTYTANQSWVTFSGNTATIEAPEVDATTSYTVTITARDTAGQTTSVQVTVIVEALPTGRVGSSGGGCDAGFGALALALAAPLFLRRRRS